MIACVAPNPSIDRHFACARVVPGAIHRPDALVLRPGGKGLNVARAALALGGDVRAVALLAGHAGRWVAEALEAEGLDADVVWAEGETRSSLSVAAGGAMTPVGSGDAFLAGLLVGAPASVDGDWAAGLALALGAGAANAEVGGAASFDPRRASMLASAARVYAEA
jgi:fructose-1-phosphate kinase PfkB-like protein